MTARALLLARPAGTDTDAQTWASQVVTNGGTVSAPRLAVVSDFIMAEKAAGTWALTDDYWGLWAENTPQALTSLKQRRLATVVAAPTFTADRGYTFNGTTNYINTGFVLATHQSAMSGGNCRLAVYQRDNVAASSSAAGVGETASRGLNIRTRSTTNFMSGQANASAIVATDSITNSAGFSVINRTSTPGNLLSFYKNAAVIACPVPGTFTASQSTVALFIGCQNSAGTPAAFLAGQIGLVALGASLTAAQELAQYTNVQAWATAVGANV